MRKLYTFTIQYIQIKMFPLRVYFSTLGYTVKKTAGVIMQRKTIDGNGAAAYVSYAMSELAFIYPITPSSPMAEQADIWAAQNTPNLFNNVPRIVQMQSESGVAGALHGALTCGALATTYTCSQGLLLMIPDMYKIAGELLPTVFHVSARALSTHALCIFGDHQDVMAARQTGFAFLCSSSVQECMDLAVVAHTATYPARVPFVHFFDGFRTSHEMQTIDVLERDELRALMDEPTMQAHKDRALSPNTPQQRGTAQNGDVYFQNRERCNQYFAATPQIVQNAMDKLAKITGRHYHLFDYYGNPNAEYVVVTMGSSGDTMYEFIENTKENSTPIGLIKVRLYRPFDTLAFMQALPQTCKRIAVLDKTKEPGSVGEPLYLDVCAALIKHGATHVEVIGGRYGLGGKDFTPQMCAAVCDNLQSQHPKTPFTVGIDDDVSELSLPIPHLQPYANATCTQCLFYGLGSDGTVGANKNSIKIIGDHTPLYVQAYFAYDSKKSGGVTISHLRFAPTPIHAAYPIEHADFIACHNPSYLTRLDMLKHLKMGGTFLLNCPWSTVDELSHHLPASVQRVLAEKQAKLFVIDATQIAEDVGLRGRTSTIMQTAFFFLQHTLLPFTQAKQYIKEQLNALFSKKGEQVVLANYAAVDKTQAAIVAIAIPQSFAYATDNSRAKASENEYLDTFINPILTMQGDTLPVSAFSADGSVPTGTTKWEKPAPPAELPMWIKENCIQCNQCAFVCPHATIRPYLFSLNADMPPTFEAIPAMGIPEKHFRIQVSPYDCKGCGVCANVCPTKEKALVMRSANTQLPQQAHNWEYAQTLPREIPTKWQRDSIKGSQFYPPLFEFSYACAGCGETPYIKVLTQLFGERMLIANATGCSSIYGGSAPACPYTVNQDGKGPAWASSLFEDNAEFGFGMRIANEIRGNDFSVWLLGGDGWAYDIGYGGLDHVLASGANINVLVLDSEVYSNTGGQLSKATPLAATARFATNGKRTKKKPLSLMAMQYQNVYVAQVSMGANKAQLLNALTEAEAHPGPSLVIAYSPCIAHGFKLTQCMEEETRAVACGYWPLFRFQPAKNAGERPALRIDSKPPNGQFRDFFMHETRFSTLFKTNPDLAEQLFIQAEQGINEQYAYLQKLAQLYQDKDADHTNG